MFHDRKDAGEKLAEKLFLDHAGKDDTVVLALPRGGVPVAHEVAKKLNYPLDIFLVRKIGIPGDEEVAMGAIASGGVQTLNHELAEYFSISKEKIEQAIQKTKSELEYREKLYRESKPMTDLKNKNIILVDDGMATGSTMEVAIQALKKHQVKKIIVAVPVSSKQAYDAISIIADEVISLTIPEIFLGIEESYGQFEQLSHDEVKKILREKI